MVKGIIRHRSRDASKREIDRHVEEKGRPEWRRRMSEKTAGMVSGKGQAEV